MLKYIGAATQRLQADDGGLTSPGTLAVTGLLVFLYIRQSIHLDMKTIAEMQQTTLEGVLNLAEMQQNNTWRTTEFGYKI